MKNFLLGVICIFSLIILQSNSSEQDSKVLSKQKLFERFFGNKIHFDTAMVQKVLADRHGKRHYIDNNNDGKPEEVWFVDTDPKHNANKHPMLVRVFDEDNDLKAGNEPDYDSDLYIVDWNADGIVDVAVDYEDTDGDQDVDEMVQYYFDESFYNTVRTDKEGCLRIWWARDDGDDNLLWHTVDYRYYQRPCQQYSHFGGDETFNWLYLTKDADTLIPLFENPFLFYDRDNDGVTEDVIRVEGYADTLQYLRWSFDADNDATLEQPRDFDVTVVGCAPGWTVEKNRNSDFSVRIGKDVSEALTIRGIQSSPILKREDAVKYLSDITWARVQLTWDENDVNVAANPIDTFERWEGIIAPANKEADFYFPQIGGPSCSVFNKRTEIALQPTGPNEFYFSPADHRLHLKNADRSYIRVDFDNDSTEDMRYTWYDTNADGILDKLSIDTNGDMLADDSCKLDISGVKAVTWKYEDINAVVEPVIKNEPGQIYLFIKTINAALESMKNGASQEPIWNLILNNMQTAKIPTFIADELINSDESMLYYLRLVRDRQIAKLKKLGVTGKSSWKEFETARSMGDTETMTISLCKIFKLSAPVKDYEKWIAERRAKPESAKVAWNNEWFPPSWIWESEKASFRIYDGHLDMFGKHKEELIIPKLQNGVSYHSEQSWGMDVLHVDKSSGCGGLTLYVNGIAYPVRNDGNPGDPVFTGGLVKQTPDEVTIELLAKGVGPAQNSYTVIWRPTALAGRADSRMEVIVEGGNPDDKVELGIGIVRMNDESFFSKQKIGLIGSWGFQDPGIGWIGLGIIYPKSSFVRMDEQKEDHRVVLKCVPQKPIVYHIQGDWIRGHQFPCCPSSSDWENNLRKTAEMINLK
ncbi:DUF4861 domain-containing protein [Mariniphaga sediminis]|uniref:DUF4861 domain-containing protein n=1 Tax=Mariniphaga sediminis TaxID=1628158 RepID=A0A399D1T0_9BACT|nr:DUF4861 family protein [Mariniphaga sediminis]RIH65537.1 DUF4861 domain-containing protein [Mariniphaga sediminis]